MKVRTQRDAKKLNKLIQKELGIDIQKYRDEEVEQKVGELIGFVGFAVNTVRIPLFVGFLAYIAGFFLLDLVHVEYLIYGVLGFVLMLVVVVLVSALLLVWGIKNSALDVIKYSLDLSKNIQQDVQAVQKQMTDSEKARKYELYYKGVLHLITIPVVCEAIVQKIPFVGWAFSGILRRILSAVADNRFVFKILLKSNLFESGGNQAAAIEGEVVAAQGFRGIVESIDAAVSKVLRVVQFPFVFALVIVGLILAGVIWLVN